MGPLVVSSQPAPLQLRGRAPEFSHPSLSFSRRILATPTQHPSPTSLSAHATSASACGPKVFSQFCTNSRNLAALFLTCIGIFSLAEDLFLAQQKPTVLFLFTLEITSLFECSPNNSNDWW